MLHTLAPAKGSTHKRKRVGRGSSSGLGTTAGRGTKGQHSRSGKGRRFGFEGGQKPLLVRQPKMGGFKNPNRREFEVVNLSTLEEKLEAGTYDSAALRAQRIIRTRKPVKVLGKGSLTKKFVLKVEATSASALAAIEKAGGSIEISK